MFFVISLQTIFKLFSLDFHYMKKLISTSIAAIAVALSLISCTKEEPKSIMIDYYVGGNCVSLIEDEPQAFVYKNDKVFLTYPKGYTLNDLTCSPKNNTYEIYSCGYTEQADGRHPAIMLGETAYNCGFEAEIGEFNIVRVTEKGPVAFGCMVQNDKQHGVIVLDKKVVFTCPEEDSSISTAISINTGEWTLCGTADGNAKLWLVSTKDFSLIKSLQISPASTTEKYFYEINDVMYSSFHGLAAAITRTKIEDGTSNACIWRELGDGFKVLDTNTSFAKCISIYNGGIIVCGATYSNSKLVGAIWQDSTVNRLDTESCIFAAINSQGFFHTLYYTPDKVHINISTGYTAQGTEFDKPANFVPCTASVTYTEY